MSYLEGLAEPHVLFDTQYRILGANAAYRQQFSATDQVVGRRCFEVSHHFDVPCDQAGESCLLTMQVKLLRLLETGTYRRVGSTKLRHADLRVISATHRDLVQRVAAHRGSRAELARELGISERSLHRKLQPLLLPKQ